MEKILEFKGTWRNYQSRVLSNAENYLADGKIHIVAAPGSGKTTLGIELIGRINMTTLILAPSITIREQWIERIKEGFLKDGIEAADYISNNLKDPRFITVATYQALHSAMTRSGADENEQDLCSGTDDSEEADALSTETESEDYSNFDLVKTMQSMNLQVICLDECHHLRSEWWKALENFKNEFASTKVISLTATPPYDSTPAMWKRYIDMCGDIDEEITIPELVKEGSLCPHQDYVMFSLPTAEEKKEIESFEQRSRDMLATLMNNQRLTEVVRSYKGLYGQMTDDMLLENPSYLASILIYLNEKQVAVPKNLVKLLGAKLLPKMDAKWMEILLQGLLYDDADSYACEKIFIEEIIRELKQAGLLEKRKVCLTATKVIQKLLIQSKGKINSMKRIVQQESENMGTSLRMLILTDYIRKECEKNLGDESVENNQLGVLPFFEILRRQSAHAKGNAGQLRYGVLCGTIVIIPAEAKEELVRLTSADKISFSQAGQLSEDDYVVVKAVGDAHFLTAAVTMLFSEGYIHVLIGTKSLLGEGWDAPCVNSLILASFVGSFMLSNQMRGRAIRVDKNNPDKTSNIWHLVCINSQKDIKDTNTGLASEDYVMLKRRMEHFLGLHYEEETIENGIDRISAIQYPLNKYNVEKTDKLMLEESQKRSTLKSRWDHALAIYEKMEIVNEVDVPERLITAVVFYDAMKSAFLCLAITFGIIALRLTIDWQLPAIIPAAFFAATVFFLVKSIMLRSPLRRLKKIGEGVRRAMLKKGLLSNEHCKVRTESQIKLYHAVYLVGGTSKEKADFAQIVGQFFDEIDNQRYLFVRSRGRKRLDGFFVVPDTFSKNKEDAQLFLDAMKPYIGKYELVYTRNEAGRKLLLEGRVRAMSNRQNRTLNRKKVKGALE